MNVKIKNRHRLKSKDIKKIIEELRKYFDEDFFDEKASVDTGKIEDTKIIFVNEEPCFVYHNNRIMITLFGVNKFQPKTKYVVVDMGAVSFVTNGADVMAPGIIDADKNINEDDQVWICDECNRKPLAVGIALMSGEEMVQEKKGKAILMFHYVGDRLWNFLAKSL
jgi:PUA domain protein